MATREEAQGARRELTGQQAVIVVGVLILLLLVLWFLFLRGGGTEEPVAPVTAPEVVTPTPEVTPDVEEPNQPKDGPVETFEVFASKDPFEPLVNPAGTSGAPTGTAPATNTGDPTGGADDGTGGTGGTGDDGSGGGSGNGGGSGDGSSNVSGHTVRLIDVYRQNGRMRAQIQVDGTVYTVDVGERFATNFELVDVSGECASILYGDDQFSICEGEEILK
jgi:hypothetical protein